MSFTDRVATWPASPATLAAELYWSASALGTLLRRSALGVASPPAPARVSLGRAPGRPVLLVHGLGADGSCFSSLEGKLNAAGYTTASVSYSGHRPDVAACAEAVEDTAARLLAAARAETLDVVAHSLGGILLRWAVTHTLLRDRVGLAVTLGTPHRGTPTAHLSPAGLPRFGPLIRQLRPGLPGLPGLADGSWGPTRWVTVAGRADFVVPPAYAALPPSANVRNVVVPGSGHMHLTRSEVCHRIVLDELGAAVRPDPAVPLAA